MATPPPDSPYGDFMMTFETVRPVKHHRPVKLEELCKQTKFTRQEIRLMYRGFKQECPEGVVEEDTFKEIYAKFFPHGNSSLYAHHVFKAFDLNSNGQISFRDLLISLSQLLKGSSYDKLKWAFQLYDINGDGCITRSELTDIVSSVHELMGRSHGNRHDETQTKKETSSPMMEDRQTRDHVDRLFKKLDMNGDGVITIDEFIQSCMQDENITESLKVFEGL